MKTWKTLREQPELWNRYFVREQVIDAIRHFFKTHGFHEAQTPILVSTPSSEANLEVFETQLRTATGKTRNGYLILSPEYALKKLLTAGIGNVFEITRCFRNEEEVSKAHNPEFTMLEWYRTDADYVRIMEDFERLFIHIIKTIEPSQDLTSFYYLGKRYDLELPWPRMSVAAAFSTYAKIDRDTLFSREALFTVGKERGYEVNDDTTWEQLFYQIFLNEIEPAIASSNRPLFLYDYPLAQAALARKKPSDPRFAERFEVYLAGLELGNCFSELTDAKEQHERFTQDLAERSRLGKTPYGIDEDFIEALRIGMPESAGIAVGVDRLVMLAANAETISDTLFFPGSELFDLENGNE